MPVRRQMGAVHTNQGLDSESLLSLRKGAQGQVPHSSEQRIKDH